MKKCKNCGTEFQPTGPSQCYCSIICNIKDKISIDDNGCWNWTGFKNKSGYGQVGYNKTIIYTHRFMCESVHGTAPIDKTYALHSCDNPSCCNPDHLRWGDQQDNSDDKMNRGRGAKGEQIGISKLTEEQVIEIIDKLKNYKRGDITKLAKEYNISDAVISLIHKNKIWKHLPRQNGETK